MTSKPSYPSSRTSGLRTDCLAPPGRSSIHCPASKVLTREHTQPTNEAVPVCAPTASKCQMMEERANLMHMMKLSVKVLLQSALSLGRSLDADHAPLQQFFVVMEHCLKHGLKGEPEGGRSGAWKFGLAVCSAGIHQCQTLFLVLGITAVYKTDKRPCPQ